MAKQIFTEKAVQVIANIPLGKVCTYGKIAAMAGNARGARQVARLLHIYTRKENLPWHRVVNREGKISLAKGNGYEEQKNMLLLEGIEFDAKDRIDFDLFLWMGE